MRWRSSISGAAGLWYHFDPRMAEANLDWLLSRGNMELMLYNGQTVRIRRK